MEPSQSDTLESLSVERDFRGTSLGSCSMGHHCSRKGGRGVRHQGSCKLEQGHFYQAHLATVLQLWFNMGSLVC